MLGAVPGVDLVSAGNRQTRFFVAWVPIPPCLRWYPWTWACLQGRHLLSRHYYLVLVVVVIIMMIVIDIVITTIVITYWVKTLSCLR